MRSLVGSILFVSLAFCGTVTQTDWTGGGGVQGPVSEWGNTFWSADDNVIYILGKLLLIVPAPPLEHKIDEDFEGANSVYSIDVDGDGDADVLGAAQYDDDVAWWENLDGTGTTWVKHTVDGNYNGATSIYSSDVDGDGDADILGAGFDADDITWWENVDGTGVNWTEHTVDENFNGATSVYSCDVDDDGDADILGTAFNADDITWWENNNVSGADWTEHTVDGDFDGAASVYSADLDGDGDIDVLGAGNRADDITWWENIDGIGTIWTEHTIDGSFDFACSVYSTDVDGDGDADVLGASYSDNDITWWENSDTSPGIIWTEHTVDGNFWAAHSVYSTDLDNDGDSDILGGGGRVCWWENSDTSPGVIWTEHTVDGNFRAVGSAYAADINGDGSKDILGAELTTDEISWWDLASYSPSEALESSILDAGDVGEWNIFQSNSQEPSGTSVSFQFRSSNESTNMGAWSDTVTSAETPLNGILADSTRFLQYKVILETSDPGTTPELEEISFSYTVQMGMGESGFNSWSLHASENPSHRFLSVLVSVPEAGPVNLSLYDVSGRVIVNVSKEFTAGTHSVKFARLAEGLYFCVMAAGEFSATERIVVLN